MLGLSNLDLCNKTDDIVFVEDPAADKCGLRLAERGTQSLFSLVRLVPHCQTLLREFRGVTKLKKLDGTNKHVDIFYWTPITDVNRTLKS